MLICRTYLKKHANGEVAEWLKAPLSKSGIGEILSGVRISPSPQ